MSIINMKVSISPQDNTQVSTKYPQVILWGTRISPYVRKVMVALAEKKIIYEQKEILPKVLLQALGQSVPTEFEKSSPFGKIPALQVDDFSIADSAVITRYLDRKFPTAHSLYPNDAETYAKTLWFEQYSDTVLTEIIYKKIFLECVVKPKVLNCHPNREIIEIAISKELPLLLDYLSQSITSTIWIAGSQFSMADIAISTQLLALKMSGFQINNTLWGNLNQYLEKVIARPSFNKIL